MVDISGRKSIPNKDTEHEDGEEMMSRVNIASADSLIGKRLPVAGMKYGFVMLVDYMGDDSSIVQAARTSYGKGTKNIRGDEGLIRYLMRHDHTTPFEMVDFKFFCRMPIFTARQWIRHRTASVNEYSARYSLVPDEFHVFRSDALKAQSFTNKQGRSGSLPNSVKTEFIRKQIKIGEEAYSAYKWAIDNGIAREIARGVLPVSYYTQWYWKINLHNLLHFLELRMDAHAQAEIRVYADVIADIVKTVVPITWKAFEDYKLNGMRFSALELRALDMLLLNEGFDAAAVSAAEKAGMPLLRKDGNGNMVPMKTGEGVEFLAKLKRIRTSHQ
jgi:thymidylate synthase (FAD)